MGEWDLSGSAASAGVSSFNTRTGAVTTQASDVESVFTAKGQLLAGSGSATGDLLATGTAGQVLTVGGADPSGLEWATPSSGGVSSFNTRTGAVTLAVGDVEALFTAEGQILLGTGSGTGELLPLGSTNQALVVVSGNAAWAAIVNSAVAGQDTTVSGATGAVTIGAAGQVSETVNATSGAAVTLSAPATAIGNDVTLSANCTFTMPTAARGAYCYARVRQAASGGPFTGTFTGVKWAGGIAPTISVTASAVDQYEFSSDGINWYGVIAFQNSH